MSKYKTTSHVTYNVGYHIVFNLKYRYHMARKARRETGRGPTNLRQNMHNYSFRPHAPFFLKAMKVKVKIEGFIDVPEETTETQIEDAIYENNRQRAHGFNRGMNGAKII